MSRSGARYEPRQLASRLMHRQNADYICGLCDEFDVDQAAPACAALGQGLCLKAEQGKSFVHVAWDGNTCVSFRLDRPNLRRRRQFVAVQRRARDTNTDNTEIVK